MESINKLIQKYKDEVKLVSLDSVLDKCFEGNYLLDRDKEKQGIRIVSTTNMQNLDTRKEYVSEEIYNKSKKQSLRNDVLISSRGSIGKSAIIQTDEPLYYSNSMIIMRPKIDFLLPKYLYYCLNTINFQNQVIRFGNEKAVIPNISLKTLLKLQIPIPPLTTQLLITNYLDKLNLLNQKLDLLIEKNNNLLSFLINKLCDYKIHHTVALTSVLEKYFSGQRLKVTDFKESGIKYISIEDFKDIYNSKRFISDDIYQKYKLKKSKKGDTLIAKDGTIGKNIYIDKDFQYLCNHHVLTLRPNTDIINPKYLYYCINTNYFYNRIRYLSNFNVIPYFKVSDLKKIEIPLPPLHTQKHIVSILDKLSDYTNNLDKGLLKEREMRKKQYEYYLNSLIK